jgi:hypothetical protein
VPLPIRSKRFEYDSTFISGTVRLVFRQKPQQPPKPRLPWRSWLGWALFVLGLAERLIGWGGSIDFILARSNDPGWVGDVMRMIGDVSAYIGFAMIVTGVALLLWTERRRVNALIASETERLQTEAIEKAKAQLQQNYSETYSQMRMADVANSSRIEKNLRRLIMPVAIASLKKDLIDLREYHEKSKRCSQPTSVQGMRFPTLFAG